MATTIKDIYGLSYKGVKEVRGSLLFVEGVKNIAYDEIVKIRSPDGIDRMGRVLDVSKNAAVIQVFGGEIGLQAESVIKFSGSAMRIPLSDEV
ncbi:MAG: hypothetical protein QXR38_02560, partial [Nitrososphaerales archaeon]